MDLRYRSFMMNVNIKWEKNCFHFIWNCSTCSCDLQRGRVRFCLIPAGCSFPPTFIKSRSWSRSLTILLKSLQNGFVSCLFEEVQQVVRSEPHGGGVSHWVEVDHLVTSFHQVPVQDKLHTFVFIKEQSESCRTALTHLRAGQVSELMTIKDKDYTTMKNLAVLERMHFFFNAKSFKQIMLKEAMSYSHFSQTKKIIMCSVM